MWNVECEISRTSCDVELFNYKLLFNIKYSLFNSDAISSRSAEWAQLLDFIRKDNKKMWNYEL